MSLFDTITNIDDSDWEHFDPGPVWGGKNIKPDLNTKPWGTYRRGGGGGGGEMCFL